MTAAVPAVARHLRAVDAATRHHQAELPGTTPPIVGFLVLVPEGDPPPELFTADGTRAEFRPLQPAHDSDSRGSESGVHVDPERHTAEADGRPLDLTYLEFELLAHLVGNPHRVHTREHLVAALWGYSHVGDGRTVDVHVARLRRKLGPAYRDRIVTVRRVGYKYEPGAAG